MRRINMNAQIDLMDEIIVDNFAARNQDAPEKGRMRFNVRYI